MTWRRASTIALLMLSCMALCAGLVALAFTIGLTQIGDDLEDRPSIVNATNSRLIIYIESLEVERDRTRLKAIPPGHSSETSAISLCANDAQAMVAELPDGTVVDRWDDADCGGGDDVPDEWRITLDE